MIFLAQMRQCNGCGSVRNDEIFNLHLGSGAGPWVRIPRILLHSRHIHWLHLPKQWTKKKQKNPQKISNSQLITLYCLGLHTQNPEHRQVDLEPSFKRGSDKINRLQPRTKNTTENKLYSTTWTHKKESSTESGRFGTQC